MRARPEKTSDRLEHSLEPGDIVRLSLSLSLSLSLAHRQEPIQVKILEARAFSDGSIRLHVEAERGNLVGWISCYDAKNDPMLENVDTDARAVMPVTAPESAQGGEPSADELAATAARFRERQRSKQQQRWGLVRGTVNSLSAFRSILEPARGAPALETAPPPPVTPGGGRDGGRPSSYTGPPPQELRDAARRGYIDVVRRHVQNGDYAHSISNQKLGSTLLYSAAQNGHLEIVDHLVAQGADVNKRTLKGATALYTAAFNGDARMVDKLLRYGASPDVRKDDGWTALKAAQYRGETQVVELLEWWEVNGSQVLSSEQQAVRNQAASLTHGPTLWDRYGSLDRSPSDGESSLNFTQSPQPMSPQQLTEQFMREQEQSQTERFSADALQLGSASPILRQETDSPLGTSGALAFPTSPVPPRYPQHVQDVPSFDIRVAPSAISMSQDHVRDVMPVDLSTSAPVQNAVGPAQADQVVSIANIRSWQLPPRPAPRHSPLPGRREPGKVWDKEYEHASAEKRAPGRLVERSSLLDDTFWAWNSDDESERKIAKKRYEAKQVESCVNDFVADLFSETLASTPLSTTPPKERQPSSRCFCNNCGSKYAVSMLPPKNIGLLTPAEQCGCRATLSIRRYLRGFYDGDAKVDDAIHQKGFLSHFVFTTSAPLQSSPLSISQLPKRSDLPRKARRSNKAADAETACNDISASARWDDPSGDSLVLGTIRTPDTYKYYNRQKQTMESIDLRGKHHLMLNRLRAERGETMHPILVMDEHGAETESQTRMRQRAEAAEKRRAEAERVARQAEEQKYAEQTAAAKAEEEAAALRAAEAEEARKAADAEAILAEATLAAASQRRKLETTRSRMVEAEAAEQKLREQREQAEVNCSHAEQAVKQAQSEDQQARRELGAPNRRRVACTPVTKAHGALSTRLSPEDLESAEKIVPYIAAHVKQLEEWHGEIKGDTDSAVNYSATLPLQSSSPKDVADVIKRPVESSFSRHAEQGPPYKSLETGSGTAPARPRRVVVTVEVPADSALQDSLFNHTKGVRILSVDEANLPEGIPAQLHSRVLHTDSPPSPPGGVSYYTQPPPPPPPQRDRGLPPASPTQALTAYQRRCAYSLYS